MDLYDWFCGPRSQMNVCVMENPEWNRNKITMFTVREWKSRCSAPLTYAVPDRCTVSRKTWCFGFLFSLAERKYTN